MNTNVISSAEEKIIPLIEDYNFIATERDNEKYLKLICDGINTSIEMFDCEHEPYEKICIIAEPKDMIPRLVTLITGCLIYKLIDLGYNLASCSDRCTIIKMVGNDTVIYIKPSTNIPICI